MASAAVMAITKRSISGSEKSVPAKDQQSKRLRHAAIVPSYGALCCVCAPSRPGSLRRASQLKTDKPLERLDTFASRAKLLGGPDGGNGALQCRPMEDATVTGAPPMQKRREYTSFSALLRLLPQPIRHQFARLERQRFRGKRNYLLISTQKSRSWSPETRYTEFRRVLSRAARPLPWIKPLFSELLPRLP